MLSRRSMVGGVAGTAVLAVTGCAAFERKLSAIRADPMSTWVPRGLVSEQRQESPGGTSGIAGGSATATLTKLLMLPDPSSVEGAWKEAASAAASYGWMPEKDGYLQVESFTRALGNFAGELSISRSRLSDSELVIIITSS